MNNLEEIKPSEKMIRLYLKAGRTVIIRNIGFSVKGIKTIWNNGTLESHIKGIEFYKHIKNAVIDKRGAYFLLKEIR